MAIEFEGLPAYDDPEFHSYIKRLPRSSDKPEPDPSQYDDRAFRDPLLDSADTRQQPTYASFGDRGTTATVNGYGNIMRLSRYLGGAKNPSKIFGLEFADGEEPYYITYRAECLQNKLGSLRSGFGLRFAVEEDLQLTDPTLRFLNDRWPQITYFVQKFNFKVQLFCQNGIIIQQYFVTNTTRATAKLQAYHSVVFRMQSLDYMNENSPFHMDYEIGPHDYSVVMLGRGSNEGEQDASQDALGVVMMLYKNGKAQKIVPPAVGERRRMKMAFSLRASETLEITSAFKICYLKRRSLWKDFVLPISDVDVSKIYQNPTLAAEKWPFPQDGALSWRFRRSLEHILSVCSIPLERASSADQSTNTPVQTKNHSHIAPIALTCGDFGDHRVSVPGSFFAFRYLLLMYEQLDNRPDGDLAAKSLRSRIYETCRAHLLWTFGLFGSHRDDSKSNYTEILTSNFWVDGSVIEPNNSTDIPSDCPTNMPMHILKATEYLKVFKKQDDLDLVYEQLPSFVEIWTRVLIKTKNRLATVWQHIPNGIGIGTYRLSDHVWIWRALQSVDQLMTNIEGKSTLSLDASAKKLLELRRCIPNSRNRGGGVGSELDFTVDDLRKQILKRFTLENDISQKRMLSVTRSAQETRFLFHSRDTVLYYGMDWDFFRDDSQQISKLWVLLAESQALHDEGNDEMQWDNPLRYALAVLMGAKSHQLDRKYSVSDMASHARRVLLDSSSCNGLFPGQIDETTKAPTLFDRELYRDFYFYVGFEIPYVLLSVESSGDFRSNECGRIDAEGGKRTFEGGQESKGNESKIERSRSPLRHRQYKHQPIKRASIGPMTPNINLIDKSYSYFDMNENKEVEAALEVGRNPQPDGRALYNARSFKRHVPYGKFVDLSNIIEISEEWLYDYPKFLDFEPPQSEGAASILQKVDRDTVVGKCIVEHEGELSIEAIAGDFPIPVNLATIDISKGKKQRKRGLARLNPNFFCDFPYRYFWAVLRSQRTAKDAKKRLIYLGPGDGIGAVCCYLASPEGEREHISQFLDRHANSREYFVDDTVVFANVWETELHCSFHQLVKGKPNKLNSSPVRTLETMQCSHLEEDSHLSEAAIGFRLVGDFFDRSWTCHVIENYGYETHDFARELFDNSKTYEHWQQRKILELILFERFLSKVRESAEKIFQAIKQGPTKKLDVEGKDLFDNIRFENRSIILVILKNNFATVLELVELWEIRESTRGQGRPRWTRNDEQKYRQSIRRRMAIQERSIRDLKNQQAKIEFYIALVTSAQESIRSARSLREAENIRLFTYLTAFFLPVGLASSLFGMGQVPERHVIITMVITAAIALSVTALILYCILSSNVTASVRKVRQKLSVDDKHRKSDTPRFFGPRSNRAYTTLDEIRRRLKRRHTSSGKSSVGRSDLENGNARDEV